MSVINQMLHDLETRRSQMASGNDFSYQNLSFIPAMSKANKFEAVIYVILFGVIVTSVVLFFIKFNNQGNDNQITSVSMQERNQTAHVTVEQKQDKREQPDRNEINTPPTSRPIKPVIIKTPVKKTIQVEQAARPKTVLQTKKSNTGVVHKQPRELSAPQKAENLYLSAYDFLVKKNHAKAQEQLRNALMLMPGHNKSRELLAGIYIKNSRIVEARTLLQYGMRISPSHSIFAKLYARILMDNNDNVTAISVLLRNPPAQHSDADYFALLAALYQKNKQHHKAATLYSQLLKQRKNYGVWWLGMAISLEALGKHRQARLAYETAKNTGNLSKGLYKYTDQRVVALEEIDYP